MELAEFQKRTAEIALSRLEAPGPRRFLVADEVGLGKTMIARAVAIGLRKKRRRLNVMYLCPSLEIAGQNRPKFVSLTGIDEKDYKAGEDRLSLVPGSLPDEGHGYRIFTFTPETSLPGWKPGPRTGRKTERALIRTLLDQFDLLRPLALAEDRARAKGSRPLLADRAESLQGYTMAGVMRALRDVFECRKGNVEKAICAWLRRDEVDIVEFVARFRSALALAALRSKAIRPELVILDEFHRYADLILPKGGVPDAPVKRERARVHRLLVQALLNGDKPPAVMLLSATPYKLRRLSGEEVHPVEHYRALVDLAGFLADDPGCAAAVENAMRDYHDALRTPGAPETVRSAVHDAKRQLETLLEPFMARTERALVHEEDLFTRSSPPVDVTARDLVIFRHLAATGGKKFAGWAPTIWSSIPYPAQTMQAYTIWKTLARAKPSPIEAGSGRGTFAHPQLRRLEEIVGGAKQLALPWLPPTVPWWKLEGPWSTKNTLPGKTLLFSKWQGTPTAVSALLAIHLTGGLRGPRQKAPVPLLRPGGSESSALVALFMPWPNLSQAIEPLKSAGVFLAAVRRNARDQLEDFLAKRKVLIGDDGKRPTWLLAAGIEREISAQSFQQVAAMANQANQGAKAKDWSAIAAITKISRSELQTLADHLLKSPGAILARCVRRHRIPQEKRPQRQRVFSFAWDRLRSYLGHRIFADLIRGISTKSSYPDALCDAMLKGGFEAVLDEQVGLIGTLGDARGLDIIEQLSNCLLDRPGLVQFRRGKQKYRVPVQAATPFAGSERGTTGRKTGRRLRSDTLRRAFNSPFWPHLLCTTSVGQEGLDFHLWCRRIIHWDLPGDPVDFEQREGRIARYGSLAVRQSLALSYGDSALSQAADASPFNVLLAIARKQKSGPTGLEQWWLPKTGRPVSVSFDWKFSLRSERREKVLKDLLYYRLALGQPDPDAFVRMLKRIGADEKDARSLALDLSAFSRFS